MLPHAGLIGRGDTGWNDGISGSVLGAPRNDVKTLWREGGREGGSGIQSDSEMDDEDSLTWPPANQLAGFRKMHLSRQ